MLELHQFGYFFDEEAASDAVRFFPTMLVHVKGEWAGQPLELQDWQADIVSRLFGTKVRCCDQCQGPDCPYEHIRRYKTVYIEIPRKNGKSTTAAGIGLKVSFADGEPGAETYSAAADKFQARIVFDLAKTMRDASNAIRKRTQRYSNSIVGPKGSSYQVISADVKTKHGLNSHGVIIDELHAQPNRDLFDVLISSTGSRRQPIVFLVTTAGWDRTSICWEQHDYAEKVRDGIIKDPTFLPVIYKADDDDDWSSEDTWQKANPNLGISLKREYLVQECLRAQESRSYENTFRRLHLNQWTEQAVRWLKIDKWDRCSGSYLEEELEQRVCYGGLDMSSTTDLTAFSLWFPFDDELDVVKVWYWLPEESLHERVRRDRVPYDAWSKDGHIELTPGNSVDYEWVEQSIADLAKRYRIVDINYDPWNATHIAQNLQRSGLEMVQFVQGIKSFAAPTRELERQVISRLFRHSGNPVLRWNASNVSVTQDARGYIKPDKSSSSGRIDGIVASIMALDRAMRTEGPLSSKYESEGLVIV